MSIPSSTSGKSRQERQENLVGQTLCNDEYYIQRVIGHGGMGKVYLASHSELAVPLAIKQTRADAPLPEAVVTELDYVLQGGDPLKRLSGATAFEFPSSGGEHTDRFLREALFLARLRHPALPTLYDYFFEDGYWYLVMDYIPGPTLTDYLRKQGPLPPLEAINYTMQLCDVFDYLHKQVPPIIFRDLKPSNIIVTPGGTLILVDFGIARYFKVGQSNDTTDFGSPGYASPEQYQSEGQTDARSDLFSLGVLLHEMVSGERPKAPGALVGVMGSMRDSARQINPNVSSSLSGLINLATRTEPMYRFQSAHAFYLALERAYILEEQRTYKQRVQLDQAMLHSGLSQDGEISAALTEKNGVRDMRADTLEGDGLASIEPDIHENQQLYLPDNAQRRVIRETLQQMRRERLEEEELESQLASVDVGLGQRSSMPLSQIPRPLSTDEDERESKENAAFSGKRELRRVSTGQATPRAPKNVFALSYAPVVRRFIRVSFVVVLVVFLVLVSLLTYVNLSHHRLNNTQGQHTQATPTSIRGSIVATPGGAWRQLPSFDSPEADNTAVYVRVQGRDYIYVNGGYRGAKNSPHYDHRLYRYDIAAAQWQALSNSQFPGMVNNAVAVDSSGHIFYVAGYSSDTFSVTSLLYMYQPVNNALQKIVPPSTIQLGYGGSMLADGSGHLYITQGFLKSGDVEAGTAWYRYDIATGQWHTLAPLPTGLGYVILAPDKDGSILLLGGASDAGQSHQSSSIYRYSVAANSWFQASSRAPVALSGSASALVQVGKLVIVGGYDTMRKQGQAQAWLVDLHTLQWAPLAPLPVGGSVMGAAAADENGHVYLERGASDPSKPTSDFWQLTL